MEGLFATNWVNRQLVSDMIGYKKRLLERQNLLKVKNRQISPACEKVKTFQNNTPQCAFVRTFTNSESRDAFLCA